MIDCYPAAGWGEIPGTFFLSKEKSTEQKFVLSTAFHGNIKRLVFFFLSLIAII